jgi:hypothetical protein
MACLLATFSLDDWPRFSGAFLLPSIFESNHPTASQRIIEKANRAATFTSKHRDANMHDRTALRPPFVMGILNSTGFTGLQ